MYGSVVFDDMMRDYDRCVFETTVVLVVQPGWSSSTNATATTWIHVDGMAWRGRDGGHGRGREGE